MKSPRYLRRVTCSYRPPEIQHTKLVGGIAEKDQTESKPIPSHLIDRQKNLRKLRPISADSFTAQFFATRIFFCVGIILVCEHINLAWISLISDIVILI
jgi:hypothetical protein